MQENLKRWSFIRIILILSVLLLAPLGGLHAVNKEIENYIKMDLDTLQNKIDAEGMKYYYSQGQHYDQAFKSGKSNFDLSQFDRSTVYHVSRYRTNPSFYDTGSHGELIPENIENAKALTDQLDALPSMENKFLYSGQRVGVLNQPIPKPGDYVVANRRPWSFTQSPRTGAKFVKTKIRSNEDNPAIYILEDSKNGKPISILENPTLSEGDGVGFQMNEAEVLFKPGSSFKVTKVERSNAGYYEIKIREVKAIPSDARILGFRGGEPIDPRNIPKDSINPKIVVGPVAGDGVCPIL